MGLGKKLGQLNSNSNAQTQNSQQPLSVGGYNSNNVPSLPIAVPLSDSEKNDIRALEVEAVNEYSQHHINISNLNNIIKPNIPKGIEYPYEEISSLIVEKMWRIVCLKNLYSFFTQEELQQLVNRACKHDYKILQSQWNIPTLDMATDLAVLGLYDIVIFADDSSSMSTREAKEDNMTRFDIMKNVIETIGFWSTLMDPDGIVVRFFNSHVEADGIATTQDISKLFFSVRPNGSTPMGQNLKSKIFDKVIYPITQLNKLARPVLIITITDGIPDSQQDVVNTICDIKNYFTKTKYGSNGSAFSFAQIGSDVGATEYLNTLDTHPHVGNIIDCTSEFSIEQQQCGQGFTETAWIIKLMIGAIDPSYDLVDENPPPSYNSSAPSPYYSSSSAAPPPYYSSSAAPPPYYSSSSATPIAQAQVINNQKSNNIFSFMK